MRLTNTPAYCSSCFQQQPDKLHVDLDAAWDGPVLEGSIKVAIDDLILCEGCLREAYRLLPSRRDAQVEEYKRNLDQLQEQNAVLAAYNTKLEAALSTSPNVTEKVKQKVLA